MASTSDQFTYVDVKTGVTVSIDATNPPRVLAHTYFLPNGVYPMYHPPGHTMRDDANFVYANKRITIKAPEGAVPDRDANGVFYADLAHMMNSQGAHVRFTGICERCNRHIRFNEVIGGRSRPGRKGRPLQFWHEDCARPFGAIYGFNTFVVPSMYRGGPHDPMVRPEEKSTSDDSCSTSSANDREDTGNTGENYQDNSIQDSKDSNNDQALQADQDTLTQLSELISGIAGQIHADLKPKFDTLTDAVNDIRRRVDDAESNKSQELTLTLRDRSNDLATTQNLGLQHKQFPKLLKLLLSIEDSNYRNVWLCGPAGTGKTTACRNVAAILAKKHGKTLGVDFHFAYTGTVASQFELKGFIDANGQIQHPELFKVWKYGGVFLVDEIAASAWDALLWANGGLSIGTLPFAGEMVDRHEHVYFLASDNTWGYGGNTKYQRNPVDQSALNRFFTLPWPADETMEHAITGTDHITTAWTDAVQECRRLIESGNAGVTISTRQMVMGRELIRAAMLTADEIVECTCSNLMSTSKWNVIGAPIIAWAVAHAEGIALRIARADAEGAE